jgi:hypothetical protein
MKKRGQATDRHGRVWEARVLSEGEGPLGNLLGLLQHWGKEQPATVEEMDEAIRTKRAGEDEASSPAQRFRATQAGGCG